MSTTTTSTRDFARAGHKIDRFGFFGDCSRIVTDGFDGKIHSFNLSGGIKKIGCVILMRISGPSCVRPKTTLTLAGRIIGYNSVSVKTRQVYATERTGLAYESGIAGTEVTIGTEWIANKGSKTMKSRTFKLFVPTVKFVVTGLRNKFGK
jgi:hypothetical protein